MADDKKHLESEDYGPECLKVLEGLEPPRKRPEGFITDLPEADTLTLEDAAAILEIDPILVQRALEAGALASLERADVAAYKGQQDETNALLLEISQTFEGVEPMAEGRPIPAAKGSRPTRSADDPPTGPKPKS